MKLQQKVFKLGSKSSKPLDFNDELYLVINGERTMIPLKSLFLSYSQDQSSITGHSLLSKAKIVAHSFKVGHNSVGIYCARTKENIGIMRVSNPMIQMNDKPLTQEYLDKFSKTIGLKRRLTIEDINANSEDKSPDVNNKEVVGNEGNSDSLNEDEGHIMSNEYNSDKDEDIVEEYKSEAYELKKKEVEDEGYLEFKKENLRVLHNKDEDIAIFVYINKDGSYINSIGKKNGNEIFESNGLPVKAHFNKESCEISTI